MRVIILLAILIVASAVQANAQSATAFDYTGVSASENQVNYGPYWSDNGTPDNNIWPYVQAGELGLAQQFTITVPTFISALDTSVVVPNDPFLQTEGQSSSTALTWSLYSGTAPTWEYMNYTHNGPVPLISSLVTQSSPEVVTAYFNEPTQTVNEQLAFDANLQPGTYWIAETGTGDAAVEPSQMYIDPPVGATPVPEPLSLYLLAIGLFLTLGMMKLQRRCFLLYPSTIDSSKPSA